MDTPAQKPATTVNPHCELCHDAGGEILLNDDFCRTVLVNDPRYVGFCRVILHHHVREMSDLDHTAQHRLMTQVFKVEQALRALLLPDKINLASLGNVTPHLHWHIIPRFEDDDHFPNPIWGVQQRASTQRQPEFLADQLRERLGKN